MFQPDDYPNANGTPASLELYLYDNRLHCDTMLCWSKAAAESGSVYFDEYTPKCDNLNKEALLDVDLNCISGKLFIFIFSLLFIS